ncbi:hypothetical protein SDC9_152036 [bioreactor metagenome]|uniref:MurNAc-LAA domain-containing protein n=1 Tax=bioreactor metagenome TaxID=1076179 RepID=A0A645ERZ3_9ZZZZ
MVIADRVRLLGYTQGNRSNYVVDQGADVLRYNTSPAITVEAGFLTNVTDLANLKDNAKQQAMANKIADGVDAFVAKYPRELVPPTMDSISTSPTSPANASVFTVTAKGVADDSGVAGVQFAVWTEKNGRDDFEWVQGTSDGKGNWTGTVRASRHNDEAGLYYINAYGTDHRGNMGYMGSLDMTLTFKN